MVHPSAIHGLPRDHLAQSDPVPFYLFLCLLNVLLVCLFKFICPAISRLHPYKRSHHLDLYKSHIRNGPLKKISSHQYRKRTKPQITNSIIMGYMSKECRKLLIRQWEAAHRTCFDAAGVKTVYRITEPAESSICTLCEKKIGLSDDLSACKFCGAGFHLKCVKKGSHSSAWVCFKCDEVHEGMPKRTCWCGKDAESKSHTKRSLDYNSCQERCSRKRTCQHACPLKCHSGPCPPCKQFCLREGQSCQHGTCWLGCHSGPCTPCQETVHWWCTCRKGPIFKIRCYQFDDCNRLNPCVGKCDRHASAPLLVSTTPRLPGLEPSNPSTPSFGSLIHSFQRARRSLKKKTTKKRSSASMRRGASNEF